MVSFSAGEVFGVEFSATVKVHITKESQIYFMKSGPDLLHEQLTRDVRQSEIK